MADSGGSGGSMVGAPMGSPGMAFEPFFKMWSEWMTNNMGPMTTVPGASLPWLTKPGVTTGEETKPLPEGAMANDPLLSAIDKVWDANPLRNIVPLDWAEITRALRTLWMRELSNPQQRVLRSLKTANASDYFDYFGAVASYFPTVPLSTLEHKVLSSGTAPKH
jgi:hypothetical protein